MLDIQSIEVFLSKKHILQQLSLRVKSGCIMGILGSNGAGKTTLFRTIAGDYSPTAGAVFFNGKKCRKDAVAFLETEPHFYPYMKGKEYLQLIENDIPKIERWASLLDLPLDVYIENYSTGMQKKLAFAGTFLQNRPLLLLDEPFNGVDLEGNEKIIAILQKTKALQQKTILISSHILSTLTDTCDAIALLNAGQIQEVIQRENFEKLRHFFTNQDIENMDDLLA